MKELAAIISNVVKAAQQAGEVHNLSFSVAVPDVEGFKGVAMINLVAPESSKITSVVEPSKSVEVIDETPKKPRAKKEPKTEEVHFEKQPIEIVAGLLALYGPQSNYAQEEISAAGDLLSSGSHGKVEEHAGELLAIFQDCNEPKMLNSALVSIGGLVVEWWDDLADHADRVAFFQLLKNSKPQERDTVEPVIYWKAADVFDKLEGHGQLETFNEIVAANDLADTPVERIDAKEYAKLEKAAAKKEPAIDFQALRDEGLALVRKHASANRDAIGKILDDHKAINAETGKPSWSFIPDDQLVAAVAALKAL
jgi:hypothetical protein